tara:strand:- start:878 stop:1444 length:567 start_codon:yes stop_codon:yes gene_type:complete
MEEIMEELDNKQVERVKMEVSDVKDIEENPIDNPVEVKKTKKVRSEKQIAAFEKAKLKRAENVALKKKQKEEDKLKKKTSIVEKSIIDDLPEQTITKFKQEAVKKFKPVLDYDVPHHNPQPIINNYYYGTNEYGQPPPATAQKPPRGRKKQVVLSSSSEEESEEEYEEEEIMAGGIQPTNPLLKYKFV